MTDKEQEVLELAKNFMEEHSEAMKELAKIEREEFYRFFVVDYFATGEGRSIWLKICRNDNSYDGVDHDKERWEKFVGHEYYLRGSEEKTEKEFMKRYEHMLPEHIKVMIKRRDQPVFVWEVHYHFNYS
jgi:hypothetical protein